jgi:hypothetical protein
MSQFNKVLTSIGRETALFTNLMYNIRSQDFNDEQWGNPTVSLNFAKSFSSSISYTL